MEVTLKAMSGVEKQIHFPGKWPFTSPNEFAGQLAFIYFTFRPDPPLTRNCAIYQTVQLSLKL